ncbi:unnamed protein product, partial [Allacma fusca]
YHGDYQSNTKQYGSSVYGTLHVESKPATPLVRDFLDAGKELGYDTVDPNGPQRS